MPVNAALTKMLLCAESVSLCAAHDTASLTLMFAAEPPVPIVMSPPARSRPSWVPLMLPPLAAMLKSAIGSISQVPERPADEAVRTSVPSATVTRAAEVSMKPPTAFSAIALKLPPTWVSPCTMSPWSTMRPPASDPLPSAASVPLLATLSPVSKISPLRSTIDAARTMPLLLTSDAAMPAAERAVSVTIEPGASIKPRLAT